MSKRPTRANLELEGIFGENSDMPSRLIREVGVREALRIGRCTARKTDNLRNREKYAMACVQNPRRIEELTQRLDAPPWETLDTEELREIPNEELRQWYREFDHLNDELAALTRNEPDLSLLSDAVGQQRSWAIYLQLFDLFLKSTLDATDDQVDKIAKRMSAIMAKASRVKSPERYIAACIRNERAIRCQKREKDHPKRPNRKLPLA